MKTCSLLLLALSTLAGPLRDEWLIAQRDYSWSFPDDHWARDGYKTEWWYFTGNLDADSGSRRFGYQFTVFRVGVLPNLPQLESRWAARNVFMGHAAITDLETGRHVFSEVLYREVPMLAGFSTYPDPMIAWSMGPPGTADRWTLLWNGDGFDFHMADQQKELELSLSTRATSPPVLQGPNGYSRKGAGDSAASMYYSLTRMQTLGTVSLDGTEESVSGSTWMDKEFGSNQLSEHQIGWDWFSLQLDDGRDVMLYMLRNAAGLVDYQHATLVERNGAPAYPDGDAWTVTVLNTWKSPETAAEYPSGWRITIPTWNLEFDVFPLAESQENVSGLVADLFYWEGAVGIQARDGTTIGRGFVELTGYGEGSRPAL